MNKWEYRICDKNEEMNTIALNVHFLPIRPNCVRKIKRENICTMFTICFDYIYITLKSNGKRLRL